MHASDDASDGFDWRSLLPPLSRRDFMEAAIIGIAFLLYFWVRGAVVDRPEAAYWHARDVIDFQRSLGFFWEDNVNDWIADRKFWAQLMNVVYFYLHFPLIILFGICSTSTAATNTRSSATRSWPPVRSRW